MTTIRTLTEPATTGAAAMLLSALTVLDVELTGFEVPPGGPALEILVDAVREGARLVRIVEPLGEPDRVVLRPTEGRVARPLGSLEVGIPLGILDASSGLERDRVAIVALLAAGVAATLAGTVDSAQTSWLLTAAYVAAGEWLDEVKTSLADRYAASRRVRVESELDAFVWRLASPDPAVAARALRRVGRSVRSPLLLPRLARAARLAIDPVVAERMRAAHHTLGRALLVTPPRDGQRVIKRSTYEGRYRQFDDLVADWLRLLQLPVSGRYRGVDVAAWRTACGTGTLRVVDEGVADGRTTLELARAISAAIPDRPVHVVGRDANMDFFQIWPLPGMAAVLDSRGTCLWLTRDGAELDLRDPGTAEAVAQTRVAFESLRPEQREAARIRWLDPLLPDRVGSTTLSFAQHDVFAGDPEPAHLVRVAGLLYQQERRHVDAYSYFDMVQIERGLSTIGQSLVTGGLLVAASVIDRIDDTRAYTDGDVYQRVGNAQPALVRVHRIGIGLGSAAPFRVPLTPTGLRGTSGQEPAAGSEQDRASENRKEG